jgi:hypothetical protein
MAAYPEASPPQRELLFNEGDFAIFEGAIKGLFGDEGIADRVKRGNLNAYQALETGLLAFAQPYRNAASTRTNETLGIHDDGTIALRGLNRATLRRMAEGYIMDCSAEGYDIIISVLCDRTMFDKLRSRPGQIKTKAVIPGVRGNLRPVA